MRKFTLQTICLFILIGVIQVAVIAQDNTCLNTVEAAFAQVGNLCDNMERNSACYGADAVEVETFASIDTSGFFAAPGDRTELSLLSEIVPQPLNTETGEFGIGILNLQANVPNSLPGQGVIFVLAGNTRFTNEQDEGFTPFQSFYFLPGIGQPACYEAEPILTIQTPEEATINIVLNGVDTEMAPGTLLTITPTVCTIHRGQITQGEAMLKANQTVDIFIDEQGAVNVFNLRQISEREYERGLQIQTALNELAAANDWQAQTIAETSDFDEEPDREALLAELEAQDSDEGDSVTEDDQCEVQHTVYYDETLHMIAQKYNTSVLSIVEANNITNPRLIYPDDVLCIPNPGSGFEPLPAGW